MKCLRNSNEFKRNFASPYAWNIINKIPTSAEPEVQNDGFQTGSSCISRSTIDRRAVPTVILRFSGSPDSTDSSPTSADVDRHPKRKTATAARQTARTCLRGQMD